jgi:hypothetical protein
VDPVIAIVTYRGTGGRLDDAAQRMLVSIENQLRLPLGGLRPGRSCFTGRRAQGGTAG